MKKCNVKFDLHLRTKLVHFENLCKALRVVLVSENSHRKVGPVALYKGIARKCMDYRELEGLGVLHNSVVSHRRLEWRGVVLAVL